jgi:hypothetical protein
MVALELGIGMRRGLDAAEVTKTLEELHARISERFPNAGLADVCAELVENARTVTVRARRTAQPDLIVRALALLVVGGVVAFGWWLFQELPSLKLGLTKDAATLTQGLQAAIQILILAAGALWYLFGLERRIKRSRALKDLHELRSFAHVIDMHQLTKDPTVVLSHGPRTQTSPKREMTQFELTRYLDYCSEMLALIGKLAALYAEYTRDPDIVEAVNDVETLSTDLGRKIWQKITILSALDEEQVPGRPANAP